MSNTERGARFVSNRRQPLVGLRSDFRHPGRGTATVINECEVFSFRFGKIWKLQIRHVGVADREVVDRDKARQRGLRFGENDGIGRAVDDGVAIILGEELKDNAGVQKFEAKHLGDESGPTDCVDSNDI